MSGNNNNNNILLARGVKPQARLTRCPLQCTCYTITAYWPRTKASYTAGCAWQNKQNLSYSCMIFVCYQHWNILCESREAQQHYSSQEG